MTRHDHDLAKKLYASPDKDPPREDTSVNIASGRIDDLVRRLLTRELSFAALSASVKTELESVFEAGRLLASEISGVQSNGTG